MRAEAYLCPATNRVVYVVEGESEAQSDGTTERITPNEARHYSGAVGLQARRWWRKTVAMGTDTHV